jgi:radical SAM protein with 4Fe4S-binding SPASM domain
MWNNPMTDDNKVFCMMPWVHMHMWPNGDVFPCCMSDTSWTLGNTNHATIKDIWNSERMRELRLNMLAGKESATCSRCYDVERHGTFTLRNNSNQAYAHHQPIVDSTTADGFVEKVNLAYFDVRFSNICNLRCRTCGPQLSSAWYDDAVALDHNHAADRILNINQGGDFWEQLLPHLATTEEVYFAGGESLMTEEHYRILDHWISIGKTDVKLNYTTNFTKLDYKQRDLFELWRQFPNLQVAASLDGSGDRGEYIRKNMVWKDVVANRKRMLQELPNAYFEITPTVSLLNVKHLGDFHKDWVQHGLVDIDNIRINQLTSPRYFSTRVLPEPIKQRVTDRINRHCDWLLTNGAADKTIAAFTGIISFMNEQDDSELLHLWAHQTAKLDKLRHENWREIFPELRGIDHAI